MLIHDGNSESLEDELLQHQQLARAAVESEETDKEGETSIDGLVLSLQRLSSALEVSGTRVEEVQKTSDKTVELMAASAKRTSAASDLTKKEVGRSCGGASQLQQLLDYQEDELAARGAGAGAGNIGTTTSTTKMNVKNDAVTNASTSSRSRSNQTTTSTSSGYRSTAPAAISAIISSSAVSSSSERRMIPSYPHRVGGRPVKVAHAGGSRHSQ
ncbi:unnamed protein product, partial [Amoebophrya sp. A25]|eukprot:GSA25T00009847001.1